MVTIKEELLVLGMRQVAIMCRRGTSIARSLKLLTLPYFKRISFITNITITYLSSYYW